MSKLLTLQRDVRDVRLACFASFASCLQVPRNTCETAADNNLCGLSNISRAQASVTRSAQCSHALADAYAL